MRGPWGSRRKRHKKLAELALVQAHPTIKPTRGERPEAFIHRQNIEHYRSLVQSGKLDVSRRGAVEKLLLEEEEKHEKFAAQNDTAAGGFLQRHS